MDLSAKIIKHDHVVLNAQRVEQVKHSLGLVRTALQQRTRLARWGCRRSSSSQKSADFWEPCWNGYLCGSSPMKKTILDLLHSLGVEDDMIMFDDLWQLPQIKPPSVVGVQGLRYWIA